MFENQTKERERERERERRGSFNLSMNVQFMCLDTLMCNLASCVNTLAHDVRQFNIPR